MKLLPFSIALCLALAFASCGGSDDSPQKPPPLPPGAKDEIEPVTRTEKTVRANKAAQKAALDRIEAMKKITIVLKPLRDPEAALAKEAELEQLFGEYNRFGELAAEQGIEGRPLAALSAHLAPDEWRDVYAEFQQYVLLVKQLGDPQRAMMDRVMAKENTSPAPEGDPQPEE